MKYSSIIKGTSIFGGILSAFMTTVMYFAGFFEDAPATNTLQLVLLVALVWFLITLLLTFIINLWFLPVHIAKFLSVVKGKINKEYEESDTYIYTRDLPEYNAAIAGAMYDLKSTFEEDYVAGVMDLIAKGYIIEHENYLEVDTTKTRDGLLNSEIYILGTCEKVHLNLKSLVNFEFYRVLKRDLYELGFYKKDSWGEKLKTKIEYEFAKNPDRLLKAGYFGGIFFFFMFVFGLTTNFKLTMFAMLIAYILFMKFLRKDKLTPKGEEEKESMTKLKHFLERETDFKDKELAEKKLWDRYPAFAVALGVNKEMAARIVAKLNRKN